MIIHTDFETAGNAREDESKFLLSNHGIPHIEERLFDYFMQLGCDGYANKPCQILTRQFDTASYDLLEQGITLRVRGNQEAGGIITTKDICIKVSPQNSDTSLRLRRGEYETPISDFFTLNLTPLKEQYPPCTNPEFQSILRIVERSDVLEQFRILTTRPRMVIQIPNAYLDLSPEKKVCIELQADDTKFGLADDYRTENGGLLLFASDTEIEYEILTKACAYDTSAQKHDFVSEGLTEYDKEKVFHFMNDQLENCAFARGTLIPNTYSKAERGFGYLDQLHTELIIAHSHQQRVNLTALRSGGISVPRLVAITPETYPNSNSSRIIARS